MRDPSHLSVVPGDSIYPKSVYSRLLKGLGAHAIGQGINLGLRILLPPLFLKVWGANVYGEWLILSSFVTYLSLTDMGGQLYIVNRLTQAYARQEISLFRRILHTGLAIFLLVPAFVFLLFTAAILITPLASLLPISETSHRIVFWVLAILAFQFVFALPQGILLGIYRTIGLLPRGQMLSNLVLLLQLMFIVGGLWLGGGMVLIAGLQALPYLLVAVFALWELNRRFPQFGLLSLKEAEYSMGLTFVKPSLHFLSIQVAQIFSIEGMVLVVGLVLAPLQVVIFSTIRTMVAALRQMLGLLTLAAWPEMIRLDAEQNFQGLFGLSRAILRSTLVGTAVLVTILHFFGGVIYYLWLGDSVEYQPAVMDLFLIYFFQLVFWTACSHFLMALNIHQTLSKVWLSSSALSIVWAYVGGRYFGLQGILAGMIVGDLLLPFWCVPYLLSRYQSRFSLQFFTKELAPIVGSLASIVIFPWTAPIVLLLLLIWWATSLRVGNTLE